MRDVINLLSMQSTFHFFNFQIKSYHIVGANYPAFFLSKSEGYIGGNTKFLHFLTLANFAIACCRK